MLKSTPEYKNHKKRFQAGYFPSKSRKKNQKKSKIPDSIEGSGSVMADCKVIGDLYQSQTISLDVSNISGISSNSTMKWILNGVTKDIDCDATHCWNNSMNAPSVPGIYDYVLTYNEKTVCAGTIKVIEPGSNLTAECAIIDNKNTEITAGALSQQIKFKVTNQNTSGNSVKLLLLGKESLWENDANINKDFIDTVWWNNGGTLESQFNLPLTVGTYTYTLKTLSGSKELCSVDFEVKGPEATCKFKYNDNYVTEVDGGTSDIIFDVSDVKNVANNYTAKLNFNGTSKAIDCGNSNCWNNSFNAPAAESEDKDHEFTLTTADGGHEICRASLTVKGTGGGSGGTEPDPGTGNGSSDYTLCLGNDGEWPQTLGISTPGTYQVLHDCLGSQWFYNCSGNVTYNGYDLECNGSEHNQISVSAMPSSGAIITIGSGGSISKLGCDRGSGSSPCATTGVTENTGGGGSGSDPSSISVGTYSDREIRKNDYKANVWYSVDIKKDGSLVMQNHSSTESSLTYKDCSGSEQTKSIKTGSNGDAGSGWWNSLGNVSNGCKIVFKFSSGGDFAIQIW